ncbi:alpha/beta hydrolase [Sphingomonas kaistensis]|uniref:Alpha/beta hydrolase n=1 Tax=Sphingomonas kaistensis TaxID=298708 RepID=A0ABZ2FZ36_9SPHN
MKILVVAALFAVSVAQPASAETLRTNGVEIEYRVSGSGEPLLMIHGFGECIDQSWGAIIPELSKSFRVIAINQRGHGASTNPSGKFTHEQSAQDVKNLMDALGVKRANAIGFSSGGMTLLHLATRYPESLSKLVVVGATTHFGEQARRIMRSVASEGLPPPVREQFLKCATRGSVQAHELARQFGEFKDSHSDMNFKAADLMKIKARTLIVHGDRDEFFPVAIPVAMYSAIPKSQLWIVPRGDHSPTAGAPQEVFTQTVKTFLAP